MANDAAAPPISYTQQIRPILSDNCFACHGPDENAREAGLRLDLQASAIEDLGGYAAIVPGDAAASELVKRIASTGDDRMPPADSHKSLSESDIKVLREWIAQGAPYEQHWSYRPIKRPPIPSKANPTSENPIDAFIRRQLETPGQKLSPQADRATLVRRLYFDLLGVPPTWEEVQAFASDDSPDAYEKLVDRLLVDPRFGERMAVGWLDLVRYADTIGYHSDNFMEISAYRDYVIDSFNNNKAFNQFAIEQLAGDLLPSPTREQLIASGYNRLLQTTEEGGAQPKEYFAIYAADRVRNFSEVWIGSTMGCAQCHDHKYDPFTTRDFYSMAAFFADVTEQAIGARDPNLRLPTPKQQDQLQKLEYEFDRMQLDRYLARHAKLAKTVEEGRSEWEENIREQIAAGIVWTSPYPRDFQCHSSRMELRRLPDNSLVVTDAAPYEATYEVDMQVTSTVASVRLETLTHPLFRGNNRFSNNHRDFVLTEFRLELDGQPVKIAHATSEFEQPGFPVSAAIDGNEKIGWAIAGHPQTDRIAAQFHLAEPIELGNQTKTLRATLVQRSVFSRHHVGRFRVGISADAKAPIDAPNAVPQNVIDAVLTPVALRTMEQNTWIDQYYRSLTPLLDPWRTRRNELQRQLVQLKDTFQSTLVAEAMPQPRVTRILPRGNWQDDSGDVVQPAVPQFLSSKQTTGGRLSRLDLARWVTSDQNPLTARTQVNRLWKTFFGGGLSRNLGDLGGQGSPPTHPELLDWLAAEFRDSGWNIKHLVRLLVTSAAYQQSSFASPELLAADPTNNWYARQGRWRVEAEFVRDSALQLAGLLDDGRIGGRSVRPYQPAGYWQHLNFPTRQWHPSRGADLYRRSLYTLWCRSFLHPSMLAFDAPSREECTAERARSNIPQQALVLLNDPIFVEAARAFAQRICEVEGTTEEKLRWALRHALLREPTEEERNVLAAVYQAQKTVFADAPDEAAKLLKVGDSPRPAELDAVELATWTQVARTLLGTYETTSRY